MIDARSTCSDSRRRSGPVEKKNRKKKKEKRKKRKEEREGRGGEGFERARIPIRECLITNDGCRFSIVIRRSTARASSFPPSNRMQIRIRRTWFRTLLSARVVDHWLELIAPRPGLKSDWFVREIRLKFGEIGDSFLLLFLKI